MTDKFNATYLAPCWNQLQIRPIIAPALAGMPYDSRIDDAMKTLSPTEQRAVIASLWREVVHLKDMMIDKKTVARKAGMTVSWLDNSDSQKAQKLRASGIRYGISQASPIRFPKSKVMQICRVNEASASSQT